MLRVLLLFFLLLLFTFYRNLRLHFFLIFNFWLVSGRFFSSRRVFLLFHKTFDVQIDCFLLFFLLLLLLFFNKSGSIFRLLFLNSNDPDLVIEDHDRHKVILVKFFDKFMDVLSDNLPFLSFHGFAWADIKKEDIVFNIVGREDRILRTG